jgi:hypothetical protein
LELDGFFGTMQAIENGYWMYLAQDRDQLQDLVNMVMNFQVP